MDVVRWWVPLCLLAGCQLVYPLEPASDVCGGNGPSALFTGCVEPAINTFTPPASLSTGEPAGATDDCSQIFTQQDLDGTELCVIAAERIEIGNTIVVGGRPILFAASLDLVVTGTLSVGSRIDRPTGAGGNFVTCATAIDGEVEDDVAGSAGAGGAGGSYGLDGGRGGQGVGGTSGGDAMREPLPPTVIRGGCRGGSGGANTVTSTAGGIGGDSGGAVYLLAGQTLTISGTIDASGSGGNGGEAGTSSGGGGGGGGGSGGLIGLDAPAIVLTDTAKLIANGGGGGAGGPSTGAAGAPGESADPIVYPFRSPGGETVGAGDGGNGGNQESTATNGTGESESGGAGGGGGGGSIGFVLLFGALDRAPLAASSPEL
jgi:hypothetical protein